MQVRPCGIGPTWNDVAQPWPNPGRFLPKSGQIRSKSKTIRLNSAKNLHTSTQIRSQSADTGRIRADFGQIWSKLAGFGPSPGQIWSFSAKLGRTLPILLEMWAKLGGLRATLGRSPTKCGRNRTRDGKSCPAVLLNPGHLWTESGRLRPKSDRNRPDLIEFGPSQILDSFSSGKLTTHQTCFSCSCYVTVAHNPIRRRRPPGSGISAAL